MSGNDPIKGLRDLAAKTAAEFLAMNDIDQLLWGFDQDEIDEDGEATVGFDMFYDKVSGREFRFEFAANISTRGLPEVVKDIFLLRLPNDKLIEQTSTKTDTKPPGRGWVLSSKDNEHSWWRRWHDVAAHADPANWGDDAFRTLHPAYWSDPDETGRRFLSRPPLQRDALLAVLRGQHRGGR